LDRFDQGLKKANSSWQSSAMADSSSELSADVGTDAMSSEWSRRVFAKISFSRVRPLFFFGLVFCSVFRAQSQEWNPVTDAPIVIEPVPDATEAGPQFGGPVASRSKMTGDWFGRRSCLAERGLALDIYGTQFYQGVASGGRNRDWEYGGKLDYLLGLDGGKLGLWQGFFVNLHGETRFGNSVNQIDGLIAPANIAMSFPREGEDITALTGIKFTQALSENFVVFAGKLNTLDEYALQFDRTLGLSRPGIGGFMNTSLVFNPILARTVPYSAIAVGGAILREGEPVFAFTMFDPRERATIGFEDPYAEGVVFAPELILRTNFFNRRGILDLGGAYSTASYRSVDPSAYLNVPGEGLPDAQEQGSWSLFANGYQAIWVDPSDESRDWGVFSQLGLSDGNPNPIRRVAVAGLAGKSMIPGRKIDTFGVGYFYLDLSDQFKGLAAPFIPQRDEHGVELFYNCAITPWSRFTMDLQVAEPSTRAFDTVIIPGIRLDVIF